MLESWKPLKTWTLTLCCPCMPYVFILHFSTIFKDSTFQVVLRLSSQYNPVQTRNSLESTYDDANLGICKGSALCSQLAKNSLPMDAIGGCK